MSTYFPTKKGTDLDPQVGQPPAVHTLAGHDPSSPEALAAAAAAEPEINSFLSRARQNVANSIHDYHAANYAGQDADVNYRNHRGQERITVTPKPNYSQDQPEAAEETQGQDQPVPPPLVDNPLAVGTDLYLMVLFTNTTQPPQSGPFVNGIAAIKMTSLPSGSLAADYVAQSKDSKWSPHAGEILTTLQMKIGTKVLILAPLDLTGQHSPTTYQLMSTQLTDVIATQGDLSSVPIMNGSGAGAVWTMGGGFELDPTRGKFLLIQSMAKEAGRVVEPCAIDSDGTCYYFPTITGPSALMLDGKSTSASYPTCASIQTDLIAQTKLVTDQNQINVFSPEVFTKNVLTNNTDSGTNSGGHGPLNVLNTTNITKTVIAIGPVKTPGTIAAQAYYGTAPMGTLPTVAGLTTAVAETDTPSYDVGSNQAQPVTSGQGANVNLTSKCPLMTSPHTAGQISCTLFDMSGLCQSKSKMEPDPTQKANVIAGGGIAYQNTGQDPSSSEFNQILKIMDAQYQYLSGVTYPDVPSDHPYSTPQVAENYADELRSIMLSQSNVYQSRDIVCTPLVTYTSTSPDGTSGYTTGDAASDAGFPVPSDSLIGAVGNQDFYSQSYIYLNNPYSKAYKVTATSNSSVEVFSDTLINNAGPDVSPNYGTFRVHAFPFALGSGSSAKAWYTKLSYQFGVETVDVHTPYGTYSNVGNEEDFTPWLHLTNGTHLLQGYYIGSKPYLYVDGKSGLNLIDQVAKLCQCAATEIVTMLMDIELDTIKKIANVQSVSYSASAKGDPGPPPGRSSNPV